LVKGNYGDVVFGATRYKMLGSGHMGGSRITEFRLRVGFLHFNPLYTGGLHLSAMRRIATSQEMAPWRLGKIYDRPIPRRIIEEAGVPRGSFGTTKAFSAFYEFNSPADMSPEGRAAFELYRHSMPRPTLLRRAWYWGLIRLRPRCETLGKTIKSFWWTGGTAAESLIPSHYRAYDDMDFATHWGQARVRERYVEAVTAHAKDL